MMQTTANNPPPAVPTIPAAMTRGLARSVLLANAAAAAVAACVLLVLGRSDYWPAFAAAVVVAAAGAGLSVLVLSLAAGRGVDWLVTYVMAASGVRLFASLIGLLVAVKGFHTQPEVTGVLVCLFYVITLGVESLRLHAAASPVGDNHA